MKQTERWTRWTTAVATLISARPSPETRRSYQKAWAKWLDHLDGRGPWEATRADVLAWLKRLRARGLQKNTVATYLACCHALWQELRQTGELLAPDAADIFTAADTGLCPHPTRRRIPALTAEQVAALLANIRTDTLTGARDYALLGLLLATGGRTGEVLALRIGEVRPPAAPDSHATVIFGTRSVPIPRHIYEALLAYLDLAGRWHAQPEHYIWRPLRNDAASRFGHDLPADRPISDAQLTNILRKRLEWASIAEPERYSATSLRATYVRQWQSVQPENMAELQRRLGHKHLVTTQQWFVV